MFLLYKEMNHLYVYVYPFPLGFPSPPPSHPSRSSQSIKLSSLCSLYRRFPLAIYFTHGSVFMSNLISQFQIWVFFNAWIAQKQKCGSFHDFLYWFIHKVFSVTSRCCVWSRSQTLLSASWQYLHSSTIKYCMKRMRDTVKHHLAYKFKCQCLDQRDKREGEWRSSLFGDSRGKSLVWVGKEARKISFR